MKWLHTFDYAAIMFFIVLCLFYGFDGVNVIVKIVFGLYGLTLLIRLFVSKR